MGARYKHWKPPATTDGCQNDAVFVSAAPAAATIITSITQNSFCQAQPANRTMKALGAEPRSSALLAGEGNV